MYLETANILLLVHAATAISVASTPSSYSSAPGDSNYGAASTAEPPVDYKSAAHGQFPYARQYLEPSSPYASNPYAEQLSQLTPRPSLFHRIPFYPSAPLASSPAYEPYQLHGYLPQQPYPVGDYPSQQPFEQQYPFHHKFAKSPLAPDCDFQPLAFRNTRPLLFRPYKSDSYFEPSPLLPKPANPLYRFQPSPLGLNLGNNIYQ